MAPHELYASLLVRAEREAERPPTLDLFGSMLGSEKDASDLLEELAVRAGVDPTTHHLRHMSRQETTRYWAELGGAERADQELPDRVEPERDRGILEQLGIDPQDLLGNLPGGLTDKLGL